MELCSRGSLPGYWDPLTSQSWSKRKLQQLARLREAWVPVVSRLHLAPLHVVLLLPYAHIYMDRYMFLFFLFFTKT